MTFEKTKRYLLLLLTLVFVTHPVFADYHPRPNSGLDGWLWERMGDGVESGMKAGAEALAKEWLGILAKTIVDYFSPSITELLFGSDDAMAAHAKRIIEEVHAVHADLADRHRDLLDEMQDQFEADVEGHFNNAVLTLNSWSSIENPMMRIDNENSPLHDIILDLGVVRNTIQAYIDARSDNPRIQHRRLQLIPMHMMATQLEIMCWQFHYNNLAIERAFMRSHPIDGEYASWDDFNAWRLGLTPEDLDIIQDEANSYIPFCETITLDVLDFYDRTAAIDDERAYIDDIFTPVVSHMVVFLGNENMYDSSAEMNDLSKWETPEVDCSIWGGVCSAYVHLDAPRFYYYVDVPGPECLDGYVYRTLVETDFFFWAENPDAPSVSECNRYWIVDRDWYSSAQPEYDAAKGSFEGYDQWFDDSFQIRDLHKELEHGDALLGNYGPVAIFLDNLYAEYMGGTRAHNHWDDVLWRYDELVGLLGAGNSYTGAVAASARLAAECGATIESVGLEMWYEMLVAAVEYPDDPIMCHDAFEGNNSFAHASQTGAGYYRNLNLNTPGDIDIFAFELLGNNSVLVQLEYSDEFLHAPDVELYWQGPDDEEPRFLARASEHSEYGWSIALPEDEDEIFRHTRKIVFVVVSSDDDELGSYNLAIQTRGPEWEDSGSSDSSSGGFSSGYVSMMSVLTGSEDSSMTTTGMVAMDGSIAAISTTEKTMTSSIATLFPEDSIEWIPETRDAYRLDPISTGDGSTLISDEKSVTVKGIINTGGEWFANHFFLGLDGGADKDQYVVEVPRGYKIEVSAVALLSGVGVPYVEFDDPWLREGAEERVETEPEHKNTVVAYPYFGRNSSKDISFTVQGLYNKNYRNYRRDTGPYKLTIKLIRYSLTSINGALCTIKDDIAHQLAKDMHDPSDLGPLMDWKILLTVAQIPDRPGDPFVLYAVDQMSGQPISKHVFKVEELKSMKLFNTALTNFNTFEMGSAAFILQGINGYK